MHSSVKLFPPLTKMKLELMESGFQRRVFRLEHQGRVVLIEYDGFLEALRYTEADSTTVVRLKTSSQEIVLGDLVLFLNVRRAFLRGEQGFTYFEISSSPQTVPFYKETPIESFDFHAVLRFPLYKTPLVFVFLALLLQIILFYHP